MRECDNSERLIIPMLFITSVGKVQFIEVYPRGDNFFFRNCSVSGEAAGSARLSQRDVVGAASRPSRYDLVAELRQLRGLQRSARVRIQ